MSSIPISNKDQVVLPIAERDRNAPITPAPTKNMTSLKEIQGLLKFDGGKVDISKMRVTDYKN